MSERSVSRQRQGKRWYTVLAPEEFDRAELGETMAEEPEQVVGRTVETTLGEITGDQGQDNIKLIFKITDVGSDAAYTEFIQHELTRDYLRSMVRRGASKIDLSRTVRTTDDYRVRVHPVAFTTKKADRSQEQAIRKIMIDLVDDAAEERTFDELVDSVVEGRLSSAIYGEAKTIYPLRRVEVKKLSLEARPEEIAAEEEASVDVDDDE
ncbi:30S ribosomal protein S3ae [Halobaculum sp. CBA1158]|uniref:30S ribosomal protein S3ae n=1 Tax=Halobaculum sp. CBA1158 TaxID=2904243 RepID=UPI001F1B0F27|nr:30S ribosomal protein S3ae [Halobaculum sp. CBA1158]UIO98523.1 30S ribosomal protein S3ae [Halobaculum sp. CBA1158]